jgi:hypothetical protein
MINFMRAACLVLIAASAAPRGAMATSSAPSGLVPGPLVPPPIGAPAGGTTPTQASTSSSAPKLGPRPALPPKPSPFEPLSQQDGVAGAARVAEAREHFTRAVQYFKDGGLEAALAEFLRANELAPSYRLYFNIAQVHYELRNYVEAKRAFQRYLAGADAELPADRRAMVEAELAKLDRLVAQFSVKTSVPGVQITVDGVPTALVVYDNLVLVNTNPGVRRVAAVKSGFMPASMTVTVTPGERRKLVFELAPIAMSTPRLAPVVHAGTSVADVSASASEPNPKMKQWISIASAATLAVGTGVFALLTRSAHSDFEHQLSRVPNDPETLNETRRSMSRYALIADVLAGATAVATGASLYFTFIAPSEPEQRRLAAAPPGVGVQGKF